MVFIIVYGMICLSISERWTIIYVFAVKKLYKGDAGISIGRESLDAAISAIIKRSVD